MFKPTNAHFSLIRVTRSIAPLPPSAHWTNPPNPPHTPSYVLEMPATRASPAFEPGVCHICGKKLSRKADLPRHMRTHATNKEELMIPCPYAGCEYRALQRSNLATHIHTHTGERPNKCPHPECTYTTSDPGSLTRHRRKDHGYDPKAKKTSSTTQARKAPRKRERHSPYSISSPSSSNGSSSDELAWLEHQLTELDKFLAEQICSTLIPGFVAPTNTYPAYDSALSTCAASYDNLPMVSCLVGDSFNPKLLPSRDTKISYPSIFQHFEQELPYIQNDSNLWAPALFPGDNDTIFADPAYNVVCQEDFVSPLQPLQSTGVWLHNDSPPLIFTDEPGASGFPGFPRSSEFDVDVADGFPQIYLQC
ncbi:hypothetical protein EDC04DRAFT_320757 [Pisolithus marmoratus]|nr:hypothetical protein EDC04DRAFT_320757 [Pisolithus marmoratus]